MRRRLDLGDCARTYRGAMAEKGGYAVTLAQVQGKPRASARAGGLDIAKAPLLAAFSASQRRWRKRRVRGGVVAKEQEGGGEVIE